MKELSRSKTSRDAILDATDHLLARNGYKKMTIEDLAKEVGIGKGSVYLHFTSKDDIALSHIDRIIDRLKIRLNATAKGSGKAETRIRKMMVDRVLFRFDSVQHYTQSLSDLLAHLRAKLLERRKRYFDEEARIFALVLEEGKQNGEFTIRSPIETAKTLIDATNSLLPFSLSAHELGERDEVEKKVKHIVEVLMNGLIKR
jgi:AcrR family transcriptional regulator